MIRTRRVGRSNINSPLIRECLLSSIQTGDIQLIIINFQIKDVQNIQINYICHEINFEQPGNSSTSVDSNRNIKPGN